MMCMFRLLLVLALAFSVANAFYLPGIAPIDYEDGMQLEVYANKLTSSKNHVPYDFYSLPFCKPSRGVRSRRLSLGQVLVGERSELTDYKLHMRTKEDCEVLCSKSYGESDLRLFKKRIVDAYNVRLNLDNMPLIVPFKNRSGKDVFQMGYPLGSYNKESKEYCLFNHLSFTVRYHQPKSSRSDFIRTQSNPPVYRVVGFEVKPISVSHKKGKDRENPSTCPVTGEAGAPRSCFKETDSKLDVIYTYDVHFEESPVKWATRWDSLLNANPELKEIQWFSIINSLCVFLFLSAMVAMIMLRTVYLDFARYNNIDDEEEIQEESGWKLIHGDVFRPPRGSGLLAVFCGSGAQLTCMTSVTLVFALLGFLSPANRGGLLTAMLTLWVLASGVCGYVAARLYSDLRGTNKKSVTLGSTFFFSGIIFAIFFVLNFALWLSGSTAAVPFLTLVLLLAMWFGLSVPLNFFGAFIGYKRKPNDFPTRTNQIPREIPRTSFIHPAFFATFAGILPFGVVFMSLVFILSSIWQNEVYYMFGFLFLVFLILAVTCAEVSIVMTYLTLCKEDYHWWWRAFITSGSSGLYVFGYSLIFVGTQPGLSDMSWFSVSTGMYFCYMAVVSFAFSLMTGTIGYMSAAAFVKKIYASVHID